MRNNVILLMVSVYEAALIAEIEDIGYGELFVVRKGDQKPSDTLEVYEEFKNLILTLRRVDTLQKITVHDSVPTIGEYSGVTKQGRRYTKKIKF